MNRTPAQFSHPSFTFPPSIPNPNPNPNLFHSQPPEIPTPPDLSTTLSSLSSLIRDSYQTLDSLSTLLVPDPNSDLIPCPVNHHHRVHPHSLFSHSLRCPRPLHRLLPPLNYPKTLQSSQTGTSFTQTHYGSDAADLCLSLENYYAEFGFNFFYRDCPGVVNFSAPDGFNKTFTLPSVLSAECANFSEREMMMMDFDMEWSRFLPSELWTIKNEVQGWNEYPCMYSNRVLSAILRLGVVRECHLAIWVIANSPKYGILIDVPMRDHMILLITLCLKAILREARSKVKYRDSEGEHFECPTLVEALMWLASQLSILYGEFNGKVFVINILKHCIIDAALGSLIFPLEQKLKESPAFEEGSLNLDVDGSGVTDDGVMKPLSTDGACSMMDGFIIKKVVFVSQVAAAVAALHERSLLEEKMKGERVSQTLTRMLEHDYVSQKADEERKNRSQYRPIIDHDGLPRQQLSNQETNKTKTREELLAEERDYKRRRMSYRGKKLKRTTLQVTRDIIEEYMEEIKQAGGIGCFEQATEGQGRFPFELPSAPDFTTDDDKPTKRNNDSKGGSPSRSRKQSDSRYAIRSTTSRHASAKDQEKLRRSLHGHCEYLEEQRGVSRNRCDGEDYSRSAERSRSRGWSHGQREQDHLEVTNTKHHESNRSSKYHDTRSSSLSNSHQKSKVVRDKKTCENHSSNSLKQNAFDDRYDPLESHDRYKEDLSTNKNYARAGRNSVNEKSLDNN